MTRVVVRAFSVSADGYGAGPEQSLQDPLGVRGHELHGWFHPTRTFRAMQGQEGGSDGVDERFAAASMQGMGAWVLGRNMFGPVRGPWSDESWRGWWGEEPPYRCPVFVLTHDPRPPLEMAGGTVFHFVTDGLQAAVNRAREAAAGRDVRIGGGVRIVREAFESRLVDDAHVVIAPVLLGRGEPLFDGLDLPGLGYTVADAVSGERAAHLIIRKETA